MYTDCRRDLLLLQDHLPIYYDYRPTTNGSTATSLCTTISRDPQMIWLTFVCVRGISLTPNSLLILIYIFHRKNVGDYATCQIK